MAPRTLYRLTARLWRGGPNGTIGAAEWDTNKLCRVFILACGRVYLNPARRESSIATPALT